MVIRKYWYSVTDVKLKLILIIRFMSGESQMKLTTPILWAPKRKHSVMIWECICFLWFWDINQCWKQHKQWKIYWSIRKNYGHYYFCQSIFRWIGLCFTPYRQYISHLTTESSSQLAIHNSIMNCILEQSRMQFAIQFFYYS